MKIIKYILNIILIALMTFIIYIIISNIYLESNIKTKPKEIVRRKNKYRNKRRECRNNTRRTKKIKIYKSIVQL